MKHIDEYDTLSTLVSINFDLSSSFYFPLVFAHADFLDLAADAIIEIAWLARR